MLPFLSLCAALINSALIYRIGGAQAIGALAYGTE
ncbi:MAG: histidinol dehydrogenase, partial [Chthoniobacterales bacterium]